MISSRHIEDHQLELYVLDLVEPEDTLHIQSHLQQCGLCKARVEVNAATRLTKLNQRSLIYSGHDQHVESDFKSGEIGSVQALYPLSLDRNVIEISDISTGGFGVITDTALPPGAIIKIRIGKTIALGEVRFCRIAGNNRFHAGVYVKGACELNP